MYTTETQIERFLSEYKRSRVIIESTVRAIINRVVAWEKKFDKAFYEFTKEEALEAFKSFHAISIVSLQNSNLTLKHFARWVIDNKGVDVQSIFEEIGKYDLETCVDTAKKESLVFTREELTEIQNELLNWTDKAILELLFIGVGGTHWLKELTFFTMDQVSRQAGVIYFKNGKRIPIDNETYELVKRACEETELISFGQTARINVVRNLGIFKARCNVLSDSDNPNDEQDLERRFRFIQRRLKLIGDSVGVRLTSGGIQSSGLLHIIKERMETTDISFREYVKTAECKEFAKRFDITSELYSQILIDKFEKYFL